MTKNSKYTCGTCKDRGMIMSIEDAHKSAGLVPCPEGCWSFQELLTYMFDEGIATKKGICKTMGVSKRTLNRWATGYNEPNKALWPILRSYLNDLIAIYTEEEDLIEF